MEFSLRFPGGYRYRRHPAAGPRAGQIIGGGKHVWQISNINGFIDGRSAYTDDGWVRLDFNAQTEFGAWGCSTYRTRPGGESAADNPHRQFGTGPWFEPRRWHRLRCDIHLNRQPGDTSGTVDIWVDGQHRGGLRGEFNVVGPTGGMRVLGFGNLDNLAGDPWLEIDDILVTVLASPTTPAAAP